jgi:hypothetical protein
MQLDLVSDDIGDHASLDALECFSVHGVRIRLQERAASSYNHPARGRGLCYGQVPSKVPGHRCC